MKLKSQLMKSTMIRAVLVEKCIQKGKIHAVKEVSLIIPDMKVSRIFAQLRCNKIMLLFLKFSTISGSSASASSLWKTNARCSTQGRSLDSSPRPLLLYGALELEG